MRRMFQLPEDDVSFLDTQGYVWETIVANGNWLIIHNYSVPNGYNTKAVKLALRIEGGYPLSQIDMVYFHPPLKRVDGKPINALATQPIENEQWQRWSRHRTPVNPWRSGLDDVSTHLSLVNNWLEREFVIR